MEKGFFNKNSARKGTRDVGSSTSLADQTSGSQTIDAPSNLSDQVGLQKDDEFDARLNTGNDDQLECDGADNVNKVKDKVVLDDLKRNGRDVIFINQTTPEMQLMRIYCSKILIPGLLPMTFGAKNARISRQRIKELEKKERRFLGINFTPHPFP